LAEEIPDSEIVLHDVPLGRLRLHMIPKDVRDPNDPTSSLPPVVQCPESYGSAHTNWLDEARWATDQAIEWWQAVVGGFREPGMSWPDAARSAYRQWPSGPASSEYVVSVVRRHWLACEKISGSLPADEQVWPEDFLLGTLDPQAQSRIVLVLTAMPYWPIGLDEHGNWC
jgi:hypothetical protein